MVRGYHEYKSIWTNPFDGEELICEREVGNHSDPQAVAVKKEISHVLQIVGHVPRRISSICSIFIRRGGVIRCRVTGLRRYSSDLPQGGLELPCILTFIAKDFEEGSKAKRLIESTLSIEVCEIDSNEPETRPASTCSNAMFSRWLRSGCAVHRQRYLSQALCGQCC